jgi:hypothetical protein
MTPIFQPVPSLMLVGVAPELADDCARAFPAVRALRVGHSAAAVERMLVTRPLVVVLGDELHASEVELVKDCARDIQAEVLRASSVDRSDLAASVREALLLAERNRERATTPPPERVSPSGS